jgi:hypothetical protein
MGEGNAAANRLWFIRFYGLAFGGSDLNLLRVFVRPKIYLFPDWSLHFRLEF